MDLRPMAEIPHAAERARQMYADGATIVAIKAETGLARNALYRWLEGAPQKGGGNLLPPLPKRRIVKRTSAGDRLSVVARIMRAAERQVAEIDRRIGTENDQGEKDARTLALLARTVRELTAVDAMNRELDTVKEAPGGNDSSARSSDEPVPRDIEELRRSVSRKLQQIIAERDGGPAGEPQL
jgi:hypothetical protein